MNVLHDVFIMKGNDNGDGDERYGIKDTRACVREHNINTLATSKHIICTIYKSIKKLCKQR